MNVLIVHAHPESTSFNGALTTVAEQTLREIGHHVKVSDLYPMCWKATLDTDDFASRADQTRFEPSSEQEHAHTQATVSLDIKTEQEKVEWADLVIFQFPLWWFSMPAVLKGWVDRVMSRGFAYSSGRKYEAGHFRGKKAMLSVTTGTASTLYAPNGIDGDLHHILWPIQNGFLAYTGFTVLPPFASWMPAQVSEAGRAMYLKQYAERLRNLEALRPLFFHPRRDYDEHQQLKPGVAARSGVQWNPRAGQTFEQAAAAFSENNFDSTINHRKENRMKGYWIIFGGDIVDPQAQAEYGRLWAPIGEKYGAKIKALEGGALVEALSTRRVLIVEFASLEQARACYNDPAYVQASAFATKASRRELVIVEGDLA